MRVQRADGGMDGGGLTLAGDDEPLAAIRQKIGGQRVDPIRAASVVRITLLANWFIDRSGYQGRFRVTYMPHPPRTTVLEFIW